MIDINSSKGTLKNIDKYKDIYFIKENFNSLGELGCAISHFSIWKEQY